MDISLEEKMSNLMDKLVKDSEEIVKNIRKEVYIEAFKKKNVKTS
jgi:hypothetical protein